MTKDEGNCYIYLSLVYIKHSVINVNLHKNSVINLHKILGVLI